MTVVVERDILFRCETSSEPGWSRELLMAQMAPRRSTASEPLKVIVNSVRNGRLVRCTVCS